MTLKQALTLAREKLAAHRDVENPGLETEVLLRYALQITRTRLFLDLDEEIDPEKEKIFWHWVERRCQGEPVAYIIRCREFFGLDFFIDSRVLIPRPETELLVEEAIKFAKEKPEAVIADIGTGSGAVAVSLAVNLSQVKILATDISPEALEVARLNSEKHHVTEHIIFRQGNLLEPLPAPVDVLIANLPYVTKADLARMPSARYEPGLALDGGESGLDKIFELSYQLKDKVRPGGCVLLEIGLGQGRPVAGLLHQLFTSAEIETLPDLAGIERVIKIRLIQAASSSRV